MRMRESCLLAAASVLVLAGCGGDEPDGGQAGAETPDETVTVEPTAAPTDTPSPATATQAEPTTAPGAAAAAPAGRPAPGTCIDIPEAPDGQYAVADAGTIVVTRQGDRLVLGAITPAEGWTHHVDDQDDDEIEVEFRRGNEELDFEIEIDDGLVEVEICDDDD